MKTIQLDPEEINLLIDGLIMRRNFIETGSVINSAADYAHQRKPVRPLRTDQMEIILAVRDLQRRLEDLR